MTPDESFAARGGEKPHVFALDRSRRRPHWNFSLKLALEELGFGPCHHMEEVDVTSPDQVAMWESAADGKVDWNKAYAGFRSAVDWPTAAFCQELAAAYPNAKFILTLRDPERWYASFSQTIYRLIQPTETTPPDLLPFLQMVVAVVKKTGWDCQELCA